MVGWDHRLIGREFERNPGDGERQVSLKIGLGRAQGVRDDSVQSLSHVQLFATPWTAPLGFPVLHHFPVLSQTYVP